MLLRPDLIRTFVSREPRHERGRGIISRPELPQRHADIRPREAIVRNGYDGWVLAGDYRREHSLLERKEVGIGEFLQHRLKSTVACAIEWLTVPERIFCRVHGVEMGAWNPTLRDKLRSVSEAKSIPAAAQTSCSASMTQYTTPRPVASRRPTQPPSSTGLPVTISGQA